MITKPIKKNIKKDLEQSLAGSLYRLVNAYTQIQKVTKDRYLGSAVLITIKNINESDNTVCEEFMIKDGLSDATIKAIQDDIIYSFKNDDWLFSANNLIKQETEKKES